MDGVESYSRGGYGKYGVRRRSNSWSSVGMGLGVEWE